MARKSKKQKECGERIVLGKKAMETFKTQAKALKIHQKIYRAKKEVLGGIFAKKISEELGKRFEKILNEEKPNINEIVALGEIFGFDHGTPLNNFDLSGLYLNHEIDKNGTEKLKEIAERYSSMEKMIGRVMDEKLEKMKKAILSKKSPNHSVSKRFIQYKNRQFYCDGRLIDFPDENAVYFLLVKALYLHSDSTGFISYQDIDKHIFEETKKKIPDGKEKIKRINNAINNLYRPRRKQKNYFPKESPGGYPVIKVISGKGLQFFNPPME